VSCFSSFCRSSHLPSFPHHILSPPHPFRDFACARRRYPWYTKYTNSTPTHTNNGEQARSVPPRIPLICRYFRTPANSRDIKNLTLHGGGQGFESPRLHYRNVAVVIITKRNFLLRWGCGPVHNCSLSSHSANSSSGSISSVRSLRSATSPRGAPGPEAPDGAATASPDRCPHPR
jgi:hypothetical protein